SHSIEDHRESQKWQHPQTTLTSLPRPFLSPSTLSSISISKMELISSCSLFNRSISNSSATGNSTNSIGPINILTQEQSTKDLIGDGLNLSLYLLMDRLLNHLWSLYHSKL